MVIDPEVETVYNKEPITVDGRGKIPDSIAEAIEAVNYIQYKMLIAASQKSNLSVSDMMEAGLSG